MQIAALVIILAFAVWIAVAGVAALAKPSVARGWIGRFASSQRVNIAEQAWRGLAGAALILRGPDSLTPVIFAVAGWFVIASSAALLVVPLSWHAGYALWWSRNLPLPIVRVSGAFALLLAAALALSALG